ncbi:MAG: hypothetical protein ACI8X5_003047 [Planctomycetota bacterium]|jgi:hypothetical protein
MYSKLLGITLLFMALAPATALAGDPVSVSGNVLWLDASDPDGDGVPGGTFVGGNTWIDKSLAGNGNAIQAVANRQPQIVSGAWNGLSALRFDGGDYMDLSASAFSMLNGVGGATLIAVASTTSTSGQRVVMISNGANSRQTRAGVNLFDSFGTSIAGQGNFGAAGRRLDTDPFQRIEGGAIALGQLEHYAAVFDYSAGQLDLHVDGALETTSTQFQSAGATSSTDSINIRIGADADLVSLHGAFSGDLAEVLVFDRVLSTVELADMADYLENKWFCQAPSTYCITAPNSNGPGALIQFSGSNQVSNNDLILGVTGAASSVSGLFFFGPNQIQIPFGDGFRCVGGPVNRLPVAITNASGAASYAVDLTNPSLSSFGISAGQSWNFQFWFRDPPGTLAPFNLSDGLHISFCP